MNQNQITVTLVGNLTDDPELRFTPSGAAVCKFRVAQTPRTRDGQGGAWKDGQPTFLDCTAWRQLAENIAESLARGTRVLVTGRLRTERWPDREDQSRTHSRMVLDVEAVGPDLTFATAKVTKLRRSNGAGDDEWASVNRSWSSRSRRS